MEPEILAQLRHRNQELETLLAEAEQTLHALRGGQSGTLAAAAAQSHRVYTRAVTAKEASEERCRALLHSAEDGFCIIEVLFDEGGKAFDFRFVEVNPAFARHTGLAAVAGKTVRDLLADPDPRWFLVLEQAALAGTSVRFEGYAAALDRFLEGCAFGIGAPAGRLIAILGRDITARKRREEDLTFLSDMSGDFSRNSLPEEIMRAVREKIVAYLKASDCLFVEIDEEQDEAKVLYSGRSTEMPGVLGVHRLSGYITEPSREEARAGRPVVIGNTETDPRTAGMGYGACGIYSFVTVPFHRGGKWRSVFTVNRSAPHTWREDEIELIRDVTNRVFPRLERARAETALRQSEQRFRSLFENSVDAVFITVADGRILAANPAACAMFGMTEEEFRQVGRSGIVDPHDPRQPEMTEERRRTGRTYGELMLVRKDGSKFPGEVNSTIVTDSGEAFAIVRDITDRKLAEETLRASEARERVRAAELHVVLEATPAAVVAAFDRECLHIGGNHMAYELMRVPEGANLSKSAPPGEAPAGFRVFQDGRELSPPELPVQRAAATGQAVRNQEFEFLFDDGARRTVMGGAVPVFGEDGLPSGAVGAFLDITEGKRTQERLRQTQKLESIGLLAGGIAHDFNNLMTGILGNASMVLAEVDARSAERLRDVMASAERAAALTRQLLAYSGKGQFIVRDLNVAEAVHEIGGLVQVSIPRTVQLSITAETRLPLVRMDPSQLQQMLMNLVINAGEAIGEGRPGSISIVTSTAEVEKPFVDALGEELPSGRYVTIEVSDTGEGMDEARRSRIFDPFFTTRFTGRGLGLAAVAGILRSLKGGISVATEPGRGSRFRVYLPANSRPEHSRPQQVPADAPAVLVADEEPSIRDLIDFLLSRQGYRVLLASEGREALAVCERETGEIDLAIVDLMIPLMGTGELLPALAARRPQMKILLTSGYTEPEARRVSVHSGAAFLRKPYTAQQVLEAVEQLIPAQRRRKATPAASD